MKKNRGGREERKKTGRSGRMVKLGYEKSARVKEIFDTHKINPAILNQGKIWKYCRLHPGKNWWKWKLRSLLTPVWPIPT